MKLPDQAEITVSNKIVDILIPVTPKAAQSFRYGVRNGRLMKYQPKGVAAYKRAIRNTFVTAVFPEWLKEAKALAVSYSFCFPIPKSYTKKDKLELTGNPRTGRPDLDNLIKGTQDALSGIVWEDDDVIAEFKANKYWGEIDDIRGSIRVKVREL